jgi:hypothetical protein
MTSMETMRWVGNQKHIEKSRPWAPPPRMRLDRGFAGHSFTSFHTIPLTNTIRRFDPPGPADPRFGYGVKNIKDAVGPTIAGVITGENVVKLVAIFLLWDILNKSLFGYFNGYMPERMSAYLGIGQGGVGTMRCTLLHAARVSLYGELLMRFR